MATADLLILTQRIIEVDYLAHDQSFRFGYMICKLEDGIVYVSSVLSVICLILLAIDRCQVIFLFRYLTLKSLMNSMGTCISKYLSGNFISWPGSWLCDEKKNHVFTRSHDHRPDFVTYSGHTAQTNPCLWRQSYDWVL